MFKKYWPEYEGTIYLQTQERQYTYPGLNIICTKVGKLKEFGRTLRAGLDQIPTENILLIMIDYIFMGKVDNDRINACYHYFCEQQLDSCCLVWQSYPNVKEMSDHDYLLVTPPAPYIMFSYQIAFWKKSILKEMALPHENPWMSEWYGTLRAEKMHIRLACLREGILPIPYDLTGCIHKGKWLQNAIDFLDENHYVFDFEKRGCYQDLPTTFFQRIRLKMMIYSAGLKGSWIDLWKRKRIN